MKPQVKKHKRHIGVLYVVTVILLGLQIASFVITGSQTTMMIANQESLRDELTRDITDLRQKNQFEVRELVKTVSQQKKDFEKEIESLKLTPGDSVEVIKEAVENVVTVTTEISTGSGLLFSSDGKIITNAHVIQGAEFVNIQTFDGGTYGAEIIGFDTFTDIAVLKIEGEFEYFEFADSDLVNVGERVVAIGNPLGLSFTVTEGIVSAVKRLGPNGQETYIQTDVSLNPGNSGGPLINSNGEVVGVNNFKVAQTDLGFALESNEVKRIANEIIENYNAGVV